MNAVRRTAIAVVLAMQLAVLLAGIAPGRAAALGLNCADPYICFMFTVTFTGDGNGTITSDDRHIACVVTDGQPAASGCSWRYRTLLTTPTVDVVLHSQSDFGNRTCFISKSDGAAYSSTPRPAPGECSSYPIDQTTIPDDLPPLAITLSANATVEYEFDIEKVGLVVYRSGTGTGTVTSKPAGINCPGVCAMSVKYGQVVTLTATAGAGSVFHGWTGWCTGLNPTCTTPVTATLTAVEAKFDLQSGSPPPARSTPTPTGARPTDNPAQSDDPAQSPTPLASPAGSLAPGASGSTFATVGPEGSPGPTSAGNVVPAAVTAPGDFAPIGIGIAVAGLLIALAIVGLGLASRRSRPHSGGGDPS